MQITCPACKSTIGEFDTPPEEITCSSCGMGFRFEWQALSTCEPAEALRMIGRFEVLGVVGEGKFGKVFKARDPKLDRIVAIKVPRAGSQAGREELDRFLREARSVAQLRHPSIVSVHEVGESENLPYLVSDFVQGLTLADLLTGRRLGFREAAELIAVVADALQFAHERGVVHRDVKPANIMIGPDGKPCVMDFGLAKRDGGEITMTVEGQVLGTPAYMPPEQASGAGHKVDGRGDVYSAGVVLYQLLTGELPFRGNQTMVLHQVQHDEPRPPRSLNDQIPRDLETITLKAMAKEPGRRYATARALADDSRRWLRGEPILARPVGRLGRGWRWARRRPAVAALLVVSAVAVLALIGFWVGFTWRLGKERDRANLEAETTRASLELLKDPFDEPIGLEGATPRFTKKAGEKRTVLLLLKHGQERIDRHKSSPPEVRAAMFDTIGSAYRSLGEHDHAEDYLKKALDCLEESPSPKPLDVAARHQSLGHFYLERGRLTDYALARQHYGEALKRRVGAMPDSAAEVAETKCHLAWVAMELEDYPEAKKIFNEVQQLYQDYHLREDHNLAAALIGISSQGVEMKQKDDVRDALAAFLPLIGGDRALLTLDGDSDWKQAVESFRHGVEINDQALFKDRPAEEASDLRKKAAKAFAECDFIIRERKEKYHYYRLLPLYLLAITLELDNNLPAAEKTYRECLEVADNSVGREYVRMPVLVRSYARVLRKLKNEKEAHRQFELVFEAMEKRFGSSHFLLANAKVIYATFLDEIGDWKRLKEQCGEAVRIYNQAPTEYKRLRYDRCKQLLNKAEIELAKMKHGP